jgi:hypothetical protein
LKVRPGGKPKNPVKQEVEKGGRIPFKNVLLIEKQ